MFKAWESQQGFLEILSILMLSFLNPWSTMEIDGRDWGLVKETIMICGRHPLPQSHNATSGVKWFCFHIVVLHQVLSIWNWCPSSSRQYWHKKSIDDLESLTSNPCFMSFHFDRNFSLIPLVWPFNGTIFSQIWWDSTHTICAPMRWRKVWCLQLSRKKDSSNLDSTNVSLHLWQHGQEEFMNPFDQKNLVICHTASLEKIASFLWCSLSMAHKWSMVA